MVRCAAYQSISGNHNTEILLNLYRKLTQHSMPKLCILTHNWTGLGNAATHYFWLFEGSAGDLTHTHTQTYVHTYEKNELFNSLFTSMSVHSLF
jgi:hypothetical protein